MLPEARSSDPGPATRDVRPTDDHRIYRIVAAGLLLACTLWALISPIVAYDDFYYHLPFAARLWGIGSRSGAFIFDAELQSRWDGFPLLWEWAQGLFWRATGSVRATIVPQLLLGATYFVIVSRRLEFPWPWLVLGFFASPMLFIHYQALYIDLPAGLCLALGFFLLVLVSRGDERAVALTAFGAVAFLGAAGNIKIQALSSAALIVATVIAITAFRLGWQRRTAITFAAGALAILCASTTAMGNFYEHANPIYPMRVTVADRVIFPGPEDLMHGSFPPDYHGRGGLGVPLNPIAFLLSATELDWTLRGVAPWYSIDSRDGDRPRLPGRSRTGGWGALFVLLNGFVLMFQALRLRKEPDAMQRDLVVAALVLCVLTACMPRSHELRYWLFLPLIVLPINLRFLAKTVNQQLLGGAMIVVALYGMAQAALTPGSQLTKERLPLTRVTPAA